MVRTSLMQAIARAAEEAAAAAKTGSVVSEPSGGEAKLTGAPPRSVANALRAESASEGRRDVVRAMFEVAWWPMLGAFSQVCMCVFLCIVKDLCS